MRILFAVTGVLIVGTVAGSGFAREEAVESSQSTVLPVEECMIQLADERSLASGQNGIISVIHVREGDRVKAGDVLAELDASIPKASLIVARLQAENDVNERYARAAALVAQKKFESFSQAKAINASALAEIQVEEMRLERDRSRIEIEVAQHESKINRARYSEAAALVASYKIVAPIDGVVSRVYRKQGEAVQVGDTVLECQNTARVHVDGSVKVELLKQIRKGSRVKIIPDTPHPAFEGPEEDIYGTVFFVGSLADLSSRSVRVLVEADNRSGRLLPGTSATLEFSRSPRSGENVAGLSD